MNEARAARFARLIAGDGDPAQALPGCAWAVTRADGVVEYGAVGHANLERRTPLSPHAPMRVASISKLAAALAVLSLVDDGALLLDADIADHLGSGARAWARNPTFPDAPVTLAHLLAHTSSMRDGDIYWAGLAERIADFFTPGAAHYEAGAHWSADHPPGAYYTYCNLAFGVLATIVEDVAQQRFDRLVQDRVLTPLGLAGAFNWSGSPEPIISSAAILYQRDEAGAWAAQLDAPPIRTPAILNPENRPLTDYVLGSNGALFSPQGGLRASAIDLAHLGACLLKRGAPLLSPALFETMRAPAQRRGGALQQGYPAIYGLSLQIITPGEGSPVPHQRGTLIGHAGDAYGLRGGLWVDVENNFGFVFLFNGGPQDADRARGARSAFSRPEEIAMETLCEWASAA